MLSRWMTITRQGYNFFTRFCGMKTSENEKWMRERGLMTHDRPTYSHKRKRLLRASDENHFPTEIQIFMLSIRSSWNYYRPITSLSLSLSLSWWECIENEFVLDEVRSGKKLDVLLYTFCKQFETVHALLS